MRKFLFLVLFFLIPACIKVHKEIRPLPPEGMNEVTSSYKITYRLPAEQIDTSEIYWGLDLQGSSYEYTTTRFKCRRMARFWHKSPEQCEVTLQTVMTPIVRKKKTFHSSQTSLPITSTRTYLFQLEKSKKKGIATLVFRPLFATPPTSSSDTLESAMEALATSGSFTFRYHIDSSRTPEAIQGNFRKFCKGRSQDSSYVLLSGTRPIARFNVDLQRGEKVTKAVVLARVPLAPDGNYQINAIDKAADIQRLVMDIINSR